MSRTNGDALREKNPTSKVIAEINQQLALMRKTINEINKFCNEGRRKNARPVR
jgi:hypothetical protein